MCVIFGVGCLFIMLVKLGGVTHNNFPYDNFYYVICERKNDSIFFSSLDTLTCVSDRSSAVFC